MPKYVHIVSFDTLYPPNYGGAIDAYYLLEEFNRQNVSVILHCYYKDAPGDIGKLRSMCHTLYLYKREMKVRHLFSLLPFTVKSRPVYPLLDDLLSDDYPILFLGVYCCRTVLCSSLAGRKKLLRANNVEHTYFWELGKAETNIAKKIYYKVEALKLRYFEKKIIPHLSAVLPISHGDSAYFTKMYPQQTILYTPCFHGNTIQLERQASMNKYILYHGNLSLSENKKAVSYIMQHIASSLPNIPFIITGRHPTKELYALARKYANVTLIADPQKEQMDTLLADAHIHLLITFQATGIKLKLINVLYTDGYVVVNAKMVEGTDVGSLCHVGSGTKELIELCKTLFATPVQADVTERRQAVLTTKYSNAESVRRLTQTFL